MHRGRRVVGASVVAVAALVVPAVAPVAAAEPDPGGEVELLPALQWYLVAPGDTLGAIAANARLTLSELLELNPGIADPDLIFPGQAVTIEERPTPVLPVGVVVAGTYTVDRGDTLGAIARRHGVALADLLAANPHPDPDLIHPGEVLRIPA